MVVGGAGWWQGYWRCGRVVGGGGRVVGGWMGITQIFIVSCNFLLSVLWK